MASAKKMTLTWMTCGIKNNLHFQFLFIKLIGNEKEQKMKRLTLNNQGQFFNDLNEGDVFVYQDVFLFEDVKRLSDMNNVEIEYCEPRSPEYKLYGSYTVRVVSDKRDRCPYCLKADFIPHYVERNIESYGNSVVRFKCEHCNNVVKASGRRVVVFSGFQATNEESDWS